MRAGHLSGYPPGHRFGDRIGGERGNDQDQFVLHEGLGANAAVARRSFNESDGQLVVEKEVHDLAGVAAVQRELDARMLGEKGSEQAGEYVLGNGCGDSQGQLARDLAVLGAHFLFGLENEGRDFSGVAQQKRALRSECNAVAGAIEEADAEIVFESFDLKGDGGLGEEKMFGRFAKIQMLGDGAEDFETEVLQLSHGMIIH